jgi:hypothetical protein
MLRRQTIPSFEQRQQQAEAWNRKMNHDGVTIHWQFTRRKARKKFGYNRNTIIRSETYVSDGSCNELEQIRHYQANWRIARRS